MQLICNLKCFIHQFHFKTYELKILFLKWIRLNMLFHSSGTMNKPFSCTLFATRPAMTPQNIRSKFMHSHLVQNSWKSQRQAKLKLKTNTNYATFEEGSTFLNPHSLHWSFKVLITEQNLWIQQMQLICNLKCFIHQFDFKTSELEILFF